MVPESGTPCGVSRSNGDLLGGITEIGQAPKPHPMALSRTTEESLRAWAEGLILAPARGLVRKYFYVFCSDLCFLISLSWRALSQEEEGKILPGIKAKGRNRRLK